MLKHYQAHLFIQVSPQDGKAYPHHHPKFKIDEKSMLVAKRSRGCSCVRLLKFKIKIAIST